MPSYRGYAYRNDSDLVIDNPNLPTAAERCYSTTSMNTPLATAGSTAWWGHGSIINANAVSIRWHSEDFSTAPADSRGEGSTALSDTAKVEIGVGVTFGAFVVITLAVVMLVSRKQRSQKRAAESISFQPFNDERGELVKQSVFRSDSSLPSTWSAVELDSWSLESIAVCFSVACFVAIFCVLQVNLHHIKHAE